MPVDLGERRAQQRIGGTADIGTTGPTVRIDEMPGQVQVAQHGRPQREPETPTVVGIEPIPAPVVGEQKELTVQRRRERDPPPPRRAVKHLSHSPSQVLGRSVHFVFITFGCDSEQRPELVR